MQRNGGTALMFDKIVKKVFLTKDARAALEARRQGGKVRKPAPPAEQSLAQAAQEAERAEEAGLRDTANATELDRETIREAIASAHRELVETGEPPPPAATSVQPSEGDGSDHAVLVKSAMTIYRQKQKVLADLDPGSRKKLRLMAQTMFGAQLKK